jgi:hypothetical protein
MNNPITLPIQHYHTCNQVIQRCGEINDAIQKAKAAGIPVDQLESDNNTAMEIAKGIKQQFFPDHN